MCIEIAPTLWGSVIVGEVRLIVCAWCHGLIREELADGNNAVSHGICPPCKREVLILEGLCDESPVLTVDAAGNVSEGRI